MEAYLAVTDSRVTLSVTPRFADSHGIGKREILVSISKELHDFIHREGITPDGKPYALNIELCYDREKGYRGALIDKLPDKFRDEFRELILRNAREAI